MLGRTKINQVEKGLVVDVETAEDGRRGGQHWGHSSSERSQLLNTVRVAHCLLSTSHSVAAARVVKSAPGNRLAFETVRSSDCGPRLASQIYLLIGQLADN